MRAGWSAAELAFWLEKHTEDCPARCEAREALRSFYEGEAEGGDDAE